MQKVIFVFKIITYPFLLLLSIIASLLAGDDAVLTPGRYFRKNESTKENIGSPRLVKAILVFGGWVFFFVGIIALALLLHYFFR